MARPMKKSLNWLEVQMFRALLNDERREAEKRWCIGNGRLLVGRKRMVNPLSGRSIITFHREKE